MGFRRAQLVRLGKPHQTPKEGGMTQEDIEAIAREVRTRALHSSWSELVEFWQDIIGSLENAYRASVRSTAAFRHVSSAEADDMQRVVRDELAEAWRKLAGGSDLPESTSLD